MVTRPSQGLTNGTSKKHHVVCRFQSVAGCKDGLDLTGAEVGFQGDEGHTQALSGVLDNRHGLITQVAPRFGEQVVTWMNQLHLWCVPWPRGQLGVELLALVGDFVDVELNF